MLKAVNILKCFGDRVILDNISLTIKKGDVIAITGASGVGKTTLMHILGSLDAPSKGAIFWKDRPITPAQHSYIRNRCFGFIFQSNNLFPDFNVIDNVLMPAKIARQDRYQRALDLLNDLKMFDKRFFSVNLLSGGERQRVALARALLMQPAVIFADEPTGNLDNRLSSQIGKMLCYCAKKYATAVVIVTHDMSLAKSCNDIYELFDGKLRPI